MANEWRTLTLAELYDFSSGLSKPRSEFGSGYPFLSFKDVFYNSAVPKQLTELVQSTEQERVRCSVMRGDVFLTRTSETLDELAMSSVALADVPDATFNGFTKRLRPKLEIIVPEFARYFFRSAKFRAAVNSMSTMSTRASLNNEMLGRLTISFPERPEQRAIGHILGTLDDKIELNRRMNETLEAMARALFKAWFVDFEPVRAKLEGRWQRGQSLPGLPAHLYDLFPDRLVESELGEIPDGWEPFTFGDIAQQSKGTINPSRLLHTTFNHYSLPTFDASQSPAIELGETIKSNKTPVPDNSVLVSKLNPHIPRVWHVGKAGDNAVCSTEFIVWTPKAPANSALLYCIASSAEFISAMRQLVTGTSNSHQRVRPEQMQGICIFSADKKAISTFSRIVQGLMDQVLQNRQLSLIITQLRDTLLPKLISGELCTRDIGASFETTI